ncbi:diguanylate cyclase domain-containing protein [Frankia sp. EI5c]|uniref:diguanylate cyclase domain-containing protein n=1 Tax=Frankia sp. EI5c TaxID=683316 RepID=UPI0037C0DE4B
MFKTDRAGVVVNAWDQNLVGTRFVDPADLAEVGNDTTRRWLTGRADDRTVQLAHRIASTGYYIGLQLRESELYADLWSQHRQRKLTLAMVLVACVAGLTTFGLFRTHTARRTRNRTDALLAGTLDLILVVDADHRLIFVGAAGRDLLGRRPQADLGRPLTDLVHPEDVPRLQALVDDPGRPPELGVRFRTGPADPPRAGPPGPEWMWFDVEAVDLTANPAVGGILVTCHEIGARKELADRLADQAHKDVLTGLANRAAVTAAIDGALSAVAATDAAVSLLVVDLDGFKAVNDTHGHQVGDDLLRVVAQRLIEAVRTGCDRVGGSPRDDVVGRLSGDEFTVLLHSADRAEAVRTAARIIDLLTDPVMVDGRRLRVGASVGISTATPGTAGQPAGGISPEQLLRKADLAMYRAKRSGGNRWAVDDEPAPADPDGVGPDPTASAEAAAAAPGPASQDVTPAADVTASRAATADGAGQRTGTRRGAKAAAPPVGRRFRGTARRGAPWARTWGPLLLAVALLTVVAGVALWFEKAAQRRAVQARLEELTDLTEASVRYSDASDRLARLGADLSAVAWTPTSSAANQAVLGQFAALSSGVVLALTGKDGRVIDATPPDAAIPVRAGDPAFATALSGRVGNEPVRLVDGVYWNYSLFPVLRNNEPFGVFVLGTRADTSPEQLGYEALGSVGLGTQGGLSSLDINGRARFSWDRGLIGQRLADPAVLAALPSAGVVRLPATATSEPDSIAFAARDHALVDGGYVLLELPTSVALSGLRPDQLGRNLLLLAAVAATVFALALTTRLLEKADRRTNEQLSALLHNVHDIVVVTDRRQKITFVSSAVTRLLGYETERFTQRQTAIVHPEDTARVLSALVGTAPVGTAPVDTATTVSDVRLRGADGVYRWFDLRVSDQSSHPHIGGTLLTVHDVTDRRHLQEQLVRQARYDPLTSLPNRSALLEALQPGAGTTGLVFVDLDHLKQINDAFGHQVGDAVLSTVARRLSRACRPGDVVYRLGGDEFVVVLGEVDRDQATAVAHRLHEAVAAPFRHDDGLVGLSATIGVAIADDPDPDPQDLLRTADDAMYRAKRTGRGSVSVRSVPPRTAR